LVQKEMIDIIIVIAKTELDNAVHNGFEEVKIRISDSWLNKILKINI